MNVAKYVRYHTLAARIRPKRYRNLFRTIHERRCRCIVEVGTWNGVHAKQMIQTAAIHHPVHTIKYLGFDLFEGLTDELLRKELSKRPPAFEEVRRFLESTGADVRLFRGNTRETLPNAIDELREGDLFFIDGGHSVETIQSDWSAIERAMSRGATVIFDDYYMNEPSEVPGLGCQTIVDALDRAMYDVTLLEPVDQFPKSWGVLKVRFAQVRKRS
ncbi:MAG: class I SAM-dependent methyltransferase [Gemmatimonadaceae bacterium]